ncbi:MAG: RNA polymerase sigma factor [Acidobacteriota bacterium]
MTNAEVVTGALREHGAALRAFVRARVRPEDVDDACQVAAVRAIEKAGSLEDRSRVLAWLYRLHRNVVTDVTRSQASRRRVFDAAAEVPDRAAPEPADSCRCSVSQSQQVSTGHAAILQLVDVGGSTLRDAARTLGISVNNATVRLHRARRALKKRMLEHCGVESLSDCLGCRCGWDGCCPT